MEKLVTWSRGDTGGPVWERFLQEGYVVVVADYRNLAAGFQEISKPITPEVVSYADDGVAVVEHVRSLPYVDKNRINLYGVSLGADVVMHTIGRTEIHAAILGAGAPMRFLGASLSWPQPGEQRKPPKIVEEQAQINIEPITCPVLILVGTSDSLIDLDRALYEQLSKAKKPARMEVYEKGYHDFVMGPQGHAGRPEPLLDVTLDALEEAINFAKNPMSGLTVAADEELTGKLLRKRFGGEGTAAPKLNYLLYLPNGYEKGDKRWPLVLFLHGGGETGTDLNKVKVHGPPKLIAAGKQFPFIMVAPQATRAAWDGWDPQVLNGLLDEVTAKYKVDKDRVYVTGMSMGGMGTWKLAASRPDRFAAIVPICGIGVPADAEKLKGLPIRIYQGDRDPIVKAETAHAMLDALKAAGAKDVELTVYPDVSHDSWTRTYNNPELYEWLLKQKRLGGTKE
jgi:predicted peptidase